MKSFSGIIPIQILYSILIAVGYCVTISSCSSEYKTTESALQIEKVMDSIKTVYVPDRRLEIFDFTVKPGRILGRSSNPQAFEQVQRLEQRFSGLNLDSFELITPLEEALVNVSVGNIRSNPRHSAELSTQVLMGHQVTIWDKDGYWYYVQTPDDYLGWIDGGGIVVLDASELAGYQQAEKVMYMDDFGFCYENPDTKGPIVSDLVAGDILQKIDQYENFIRVSLPDGRAGYIEAAEARLLDELSKAGIPEWADLENTAYQFMGRPYLWGGTSGKGVDCSGFTKMVYYLNGLELPRDASQQVRSGIEVSLDEELSQLQPGDLLFFGYKGEDGKKDRVTHVGIHIGNGRMIHSSQRVQIESLMPDDPDFAPNRRETLLTAKRMITDGSLAQGVTPINTDPDYGF